MVCLRREIPVEIDAKDRKYPKKLWFYIISVDNSFIEW
jgi:hypothetical protein